MMVAITVMIMAASTTTALRITQIHYLLLLPPMNLFFFYSSLTFSCYLLSLSFFLSLLLQSIVDFFVLQKFQHPRL